MKIVQFGLCFSPNLGDGIIAECIAYGLTSRRPDASVTCIDISARQSRGAVPIGNRELILAILDRLPRPLRHALALWKLNRVIDGVEPAWSKAAQADLAVVGGGQIFADANLNFPIKLARAARVLKAAGTPTAIYGVGVAANWSRRGKALFGEVFATDLHMIGVRDEGSAQAWHAQTTGGPSPEITYDPGLLAAQCYGEPPAPPKGIGLCITDFALLAHHADDTIAGQSAGGVAFYTSIVNSLITRGHHVTLFSNGASEDTALMAALAKAPALREAIESNHLRIPPAASTPRDLAMQIAGFQAVIAHRLHACIVAYSYGRPVIGMGWDKKLESFFDLAAQGAFFSADPAIRGDDIAQLVDAAIAAGVDPAHHKAVVDGAWDGIDRLLAVATRAPVSG